MLNVPSNMTRKHPPFYDEPFGTDPAFWQLVSPYDQYKVASAPMLLVCSTLRPDDSCGQAESFATRVKGIG